MYPSSLESLSYLLGDLSIQSIEIHLDRRWWVRRVSHPCSCCVGTCEHPWQDVRLGTERRDDDEVKLKGGATRGPEHPRAQVSFSFTAGRPFTPPTAPRVISPSQTSPQGADKGLELRHPKPKKWLKKLKAAGPHRKSPTSFSQQPLPPTVATFDVVRIQGRPRSPLRLWALNQVLLK